MISDILTIELIVNYLDLNYPEWTSHKGLGYSADPFLMGLFFENNHLFENKDLSNVEALEKLYNIITVEYKISYQEYKSVFASYANDSFFNEHVKNQELENLDTIDLQLEYIKYSNELKEQIVFRPSA